MSRETKKFSMKSARSVSRVPSECASQQTTHSKVNLEDSLSALSEELDALGIEPITINDKQPSVETLLDVCSKLIDGSWKLVHKFRSQMTEYNQLDDDRCKILNDNRKLKSRVQTLNTDLEKQLQSLKQTAEKERKARLEAERLEREVKRLNDETTKLKKQLRSKEDQHKHKLQQVLRTEEKQRERLEKSVRGGKNEKSVPMDRAEGQSNAYEEIIHRLQENNEAMLREICYLREALSLHSAETDADLDQTLLVTSSSRNEPSDD